MTAVLQQEVEKRGLLTENQLGTVRRAQGAKEQAMLNIAINTEYKNSLLATLVDVKKAYDSIDHKYLIDCLANLNLPCWITDFVKASIGSINLEIRKNNELLICKRVKRGLIQGDSLSPLLFVLCMDPLSRRLNELYPKISVNVGNISHSSNHLLFIDDLKLLSDNEQVMDCMVKETAEILDVIGLEVKRDKSATNVASCSDFAKVLETHDVYKYLGITENSYSETTRAAFENVRRNF